MKGQTDPGTRRDLQPEGRPSESPGAEGARSLMRLTAPSWRAWRVWRRNLQQGLKHWHTSVLPPTLEPLLYLLAFGTGVGTLIGGLTYAGQPIPYVDYIAPALTVIAAMYQAWFETTYSSFVRMFYQKIWDAMTATPLSLGDILLGEALWGATRGMFAGMLVLGVVSAFGLVDPRYTWVLLIVIALTSVFFSLLGLLFTALLPSIDAFNYPVFLLIIPMFLFGETFFPTANLPDWAAWVATWTPLYNMMAVARPAAMGTFPGAAFWHLVPWLLSLPVIMFGIHGLMTRRLID